MSLKIEKSVYVDMSARLELAERISRGSNLPSELVKSFFKGVLIEYERLTNVSFAPAMKKRIWEIASPEPLKTLRKTLLLEFCKKILGSIDENDVREMLKEHKENGSIKNPKYSVNLKSALISNKEAINNAVTEKALSILDQWTPVVFSAIAKEIKAPSS